MDKNYLSEGNLNSEGIDISFGEIFQIIKRRKKYFYLGFLISLFAAITGTTYQRLFKPIYTGAFTVLVEDPINKSNDQMSEMGSKIFSQLAGGSNNSDLPTLIEFLKSSLILKGTSEKFELEIDELKDSLNIEVVDTDRRVFSEPAGAINVSLYYRNPKIGLKILEDIKNAYLKTALDQRQKRLAVGLEFLNSQAPNLEKDTLNIQRRLSEFQEKNNILDPKEEAFKIREKISLLENEIFQLNVKRGKFISIKEEIAKGKLISRGFQTSVNDLAIRKNFEDTQGLEVSDSNRGILTELVNLKAEYAEKVTKYLPSSKAILGIKKRIDQLEPIVLKSQIEAVDAAIDLNAGLLKSAQNQKKELDIIFQELPKLIAEFESISQDLLLALERRSALVEARETFQLEIAQKNAPWQIIEEPFFEVRPTFPSYSRNFILGILISTITGVIAALTKDKFDDVYHFPNEVKEALNKNILAHMPNLQLFANQDFDIFELGLTEVKLILFLKDFFLSN